MSAQLVCDSPLGPLTLTAAGGALLDISFGRQCREETETGGQEALLHRAAAELAEYFAGERRAFDLPLAPAGTAFQQQVWRVLCAIPYGTTCSYGAVARAVGRPGASRAVGGANHQNPIPILIPCHRVIGADGSLTGYGGGLEIKEKLLALERHFAAGGKR